MPTFLGIHDGHNASAALIEDGRLTFALQEERLTRIKNQGDAPRDAAFRARLASRATPDAIALNGYYMNYGQWQRETIEADYERSGGLASRWKQPLKRPFLDHVYQSRKARDRQERLAGVGISGKQVTPVEHHLAHASAAYFTAPWGPSRTLVFTCDGS